MWYVFLVWVIINADGGFFARRLATDVGVETDRDHLSESQRGNRYVSAEVQYGKPVFRRVLTAVASGPI